MKIIAFVACLAAALAYGADVVYLPNAKENGIYDWGTVGNWYTDGGGALGALPTGSDNVYVTNAAFATEWLVIPGDADVSVYAIFLQKQYNASSAGVQMRIDGGGRLAHGGVRGAGRQLAVHHGTGDRIERDVEPWLVCGRSSPPNRNNGHLSLICDEKGQHS